MPKTTDSKKEKIDPILAAIANIEKQNGNRDPKKFVLRKFGDRKNCKIETISFGYDIVDQASHCNGVPRGKIIEIFGGESGGKSFLTLKLIASAQKMGLTCCLMDIEHSFDPLWAAQHGVDVDNLYVMDEDMSAESILNYVIAMSQSGQFGLIVIDSTAAMVPQAEIEGKIGDSHVAEIARIMSQGLRKLGQSCSATKTTCVFVNQIREKIGVMFGSPETTPGGRALKFYSHQRIKVTPANCVKVTEGDKKVVVARQSYVKFIKNKVARPFGECIMEIVFDASALNPVVKLCNIARNSNFGLVKTYKGEYTIDKDLTGVKKNVATGTKTMVELANYVVANKLVLDMLERIIEVNKDLSDEDRVTIDKDILVMQEDETKIVAPQGDGKVVLSGTVVADGSAPSAEDIAEAADGDEPTVEDAP